MHTNDKIGNEKQINPIFRLYHCWSFYSKSKNFPTIFTLVQSNSDFHDLSYACEKSHETGIKYYYEFERLEIVNLLKTKIEVSIKGTIILKMTDVDNKYRGQFISTCCRDDSSMEWKLNDIEIEWE